uniref:Uncharacterized protein n=1 Tax=Arundo donax TaxID=35708 RepID=A0A0A9C493_ARUDO
MCSKWGYIWAETIWILLCLQLNFCRIGVPYYDLLF